MFDFFKKPTNLNSNKGIIDNRLADSFLEDALTSLRVSLSVKELHEEGKGFGLNEQGESFLSKDITRRAIGVRYEHFKKDRYIDFDLEFTDELETEALGQFCLTKVNGRDEKYSSTAQVLVCGGIQISGYIKDPEGSIFKELQNITSRACIGHHSFVLSRLIIKPFELEAMKSKFRQDGYTDRIDILGIRLFDEIFLPKPPYIKSE